MAESEIGAVSALESVSPGHSMVEYKKDQISLESTKAALEVVSYWRAVCWPGTF